MGIGSGDDYRWILGQFAALGRTEVVEALLDADMAADALGWSNFTPLAAGAGRDPGQVAAGLRAWPDVEDAQAGDRLSMTLTPRRTRSRPGAHRLHGWYAADALGMLPAIGRTVRVCSACPATGQTVSVSGRGHVAPCPVVVAALRELSTEHDRPVSL